MPDIVGVLLAGGESRRFGQPKAFAKFNNISFWEHSYNAMKHVTNRQIIISHISLVDHFPARAGCKVLNDSEEVKGKGPLAGIYTAIKNEKAEWFVVLSCDIPNIKEKAIKSLLDLKHQNVQAVIPHIEGKLQPLIGIYHRSIFPILKHQLENHQYKMISLLEKIKVLYVTESEIAVDLNCFSNINTQKDFSQLILDNDHTKS